MTAGFLTATCLCFMLSQGAGDVVYTNLRNPEIPVNIEENRRADIRELLLYASTDQGRNWQQAATVTPDKGKFIFYAQKDGTYWLRVAFINKAGVQEPDDKTLMGGPPDLKLVVDTLKPLVRAIHAHRDGDDIAVEWDVQEDNPDLAKDGLRLEYQAKDAPAEPWTPIAMSPILKGQARFRAATKQPLVIRLTVRDQAKNLSQGFAETTGTLLAAGFTPNQGGSPPALPTEIQVPKKPIDDAKLLVIPPPTPEVFGPMTPLPTPEKPLVPPPAPLKNNDGPGQKAMFGASDKLIAPPSLKETPTDKIIADTNTPPPPVAQPKVAPPHGAVPAPLDPSHPGKTVAVSSAVRKALPTLQYVNNHQVTLEYELRRVGPSGVGGIELWMTKDDGETWEQFAEDEDVPSTPIQTRQKRAFEFRDKSDLPFADGVYGMILVVKNRAGMGKKPRPGDVPEMRLEIDTKRPEAKLFQPTPDPQHPDHVLLKWIAEDKNLASQPITLEYAEKRDGEWLPIQTDVENSGRYSWRVPPSTPVQVFLRLRVRDKAGNEGVAVTAQPQYVDLTEPEGALIGVQSQGKRP